MVNRSLERARALAERSGDGYAGLDQLPAAIAGADLVVSATGAAEAVIDASMVRDAFSGSRRAPLVLLDLAVPRDVAPDVEAFDGVRVIDIRAIRDRLMARGDSDDR